MCTIVVHFLIPDSINLVGAAFSRDDIWIFFAYNFAYNKVSDAVVKGKRMDDRGQISDDRRQMTDDRRRKAEVS